MPSFFSFQQGSETVQNIRYGTEASPLLGRFRAVPRPSHLDRSSPRRARSASQLGLLSAGWRGSVHVGYGALVAAELEAAADDEAEDGDDEEEEESDAFLPGQPRASRIVRRLRRLARRIDDTWVNPKAGAVRKTVDRWWSRWGVLVVLPAALVGRPFCFVLFGCPDGREASYGCVLWSDGDVRLVLLMQPLICVRIGCGLVCYAVSAIPVAR